MKYLVDECLSRQLALRLTEAGFESVHVLDRGLGGASDDTVLAIAAAESRVLLSADTDFGEILARSRALEPSVVTFRRGVRNASTQFEILVNHLPEIEDELAVGAYVVITDDRLRIRRLPLSVGRLH